MSVLLHAVTGPKHLLSDTEEKNRESSRRFLNVHSSMCVSCAGIRGYLAAIINTFDILTSSYNRHKRHGDNLAF